ncbi:MAG TPA: phage holin family protein [Actinobacteria bacterium]|nr:phage holin family protein [Actinomycetota bacterium]
MISFLVRIAVNALAVWLTVNLVPGLSFDGPLWVLGVVGLALGVVNAVIKPIVKLLALPIRLVTLGLFTLVINVALMAGVIWLAGQLDSGIQSTGFGATLLGGLVLAVVSWALQLVVPD